MNMNPYYRWAVLSCGLLISFPALGAIRVKVDYESAHSRGRTSVVFDRVGDTAELFGSEQSRVNLKLTKLEGNTVALEAEMFESGSGEQKPMQSRIITLLGEEAAIKTDDSQGKLLYRLMVKPEKVADLKMAPK
jgi:hypothetical protein